MTKRKLLALDIGNTNVVMGIFEKNKILTTRRLSSQTGRTADEAGVIVTSLCRDSGIDPVDISDVAIASVSPKLGRVFGQMANDYLNCDPFFIHGKIPGFKNLYHPARSVGADRVCNAVAGYEKYGGPLLILDFGNAITIDIIKDDGAYLGGVIMPGLEVSSEALHAKAALLPNVRLDWPRGAIGKTTDMSIRIGLMKGTVAAVNGLIEEIRKELDAPDATVIATGGFSKLLKPYIPAVSSLEPNLVLDGIFLIHSQRKK